jgi:DNA-binding transcriptional ArsR family regulator
MKDSLQKSATTRKKEPPAGTDRMKITDVRVLSALAHPVRISILHLLLSVGERTATQCADVVDATPSACSYHLRHLERFGLVERVDAGAVGDGADRRTRGWRAVASGFDFGEPTGSPELVAASAALTSVGLDENHRLARHYLSNVASLPEVWQTAASFSTYALMVSPSELTDVTAAIDAIVRPLRAAVRNDAPDDARAVRVSLDAFARTDLAGTELEGSEPA